MPSRFSQSANLTAVLNDINAGQGFSFGSLHAVGAMKIDTDEKGNAVMAIRDRCRRENDQVVAPTFAILAYIQQREQPTGAITWSAEGGSTGIYRFADIDAQYGDVFAWFGISGIGEILSAIGFTIPPGAADMAIAAFREPKKTVIKVESSVKGEKLTEEITVYCLNVRIVRPRGTPGLLNDPPEWLASCACFSFQSTTSRVPQPRLAYIEGIIEPSPPFGYSWEADKELLLNTDSSLPIFLPELPINATISLFPTYKENILTNAIFSDHKSIYVYADHLGVDYDNFQTGISCGKDGIDPWVFERYGVRIEMPTAWNCFGSVRHAYNGSGGGKDDFLSNPMKSWPTSAQRTPRRGDVTHYYMILPNGLKNGLHAQTFIDQNKTYAANNEPPIDLLLQTWKWAISQSGDWHKSLLDPTIPIVQYEILYKP